MPTRTFSAGLLPFDLTRGGTPVRLSRHRATSTSTRSTCRTRSRPATSCSTSAFAAITTTAWSPTTAPEPRAGIAYNIKKTGHGAARRLRAHLRNAVQRESAAVERDRRGRAGAERLRLQLRCPSSPGFRNQFNTGFQQAIGQISADRRRLLLEVHAQRVRFQHAAEHDHHVSDLLAQFEARWRHRPRQHHQPARASRRTGPSATRARAISRRKTAA